MQRLSFAPSAGMTLAVVVVQASFVCSAYLLLRLSGVLPWCLSQILLAIAFFQAFGLLHECVHGSATRSIRLNNWLGHWASVFCFLPFVPWKLIHHEHHAWAGNLERDPGLKTVRRWREAHAVPLAMRVLWRSWIPLGALLQHIVFWTYPFELLRSTPRDVDKLTRSLGSVLFMVVAYWGAYTLWPEMFSVRALGGALFLYLVVTELVNLPHHLDLLGEEGQLPLWEQWRPTRSCYYPPFIGELCVLNFNFHIEHHLFPRLPWFRLRAAHGLLREALADDYRECIGFSWNVENRRRPIADVIGIRPPT